MAITDPSPFVPDEAPDTSSSDKWLGQGPAMAASGNIGGLMQALSANAAPTTPAPSKGILSRDQIDQVSGSMASRIRTPDQMAAGKAERRGAFDQMKEANLAAAQDDWSPQRYMALGSMEGQLLKPWDAGSTSAHGTMRAYQAELDQINALKKAKLDNAKGELVFQQGEEKSDDANEKNVLSDYAKMAAAQARVEGIQAKMNNPLSMVGNFNGSLIYKGQYAADGTMLVPPRVLIPSGKKQELEAKFLKMAEEEAATKGSQFVDGNGMTAMEARQDWVNKRAKAMAQEFLINSIGSGPSTLIAGSSPAMPASTAPGAATAQAATGNPATTPPLKPPGAAGAPGAAGGEVIGGLPTATNAQGHKVLTPGAFNQASTDRIAILQQELKREMDRPVNPADPDDGPRKAKNIEALNNDIARMQKAAGAASAPAAAPAAPGGIVKMPNAQLQTNGEQATENAIGTGQGNAIIKDVAAVKAKAAGAANTITSMNNVLALGTQIEPGAFNDWKAKAVPFMQAFGIGKDISDKWKSINDAQVAIQHALNDEIKNQPDAARFTDKDADRVLKEMSSVTNTADAFKLAANIKKEIAYRNLAVANHVSPLQNDKDYIQGRKTIAQAEMDKTNSFGPSFMRFPTADGKGQENKFRHEAIAETMKANGLTMDDTSPRGMKVRAAAENAWNEKAAQRGLK